MRGRARGKEEGEDVIYKDSAAVGQSLEGSWGSSDMPASTPTPGSHSHGALGRVGCPLCGTKHVMTVAIKALGRILSSALVSCIHTPARVFICVLNLPDLGYCVMCEYTHSQLLAAM